MSSYREKELKYFYCKNCENEHVDHFHRERAAANKLVRRTEKKLKEIFMQACRVLLRNTTLFPKTLSPKITGGKSEVNVGTPTSHTHGNCH